MQALDLEISSIDDSLIMSVHDVDVLQQTLNDRLQPWVLNLKFSCVFKDWQGWASLEDLFCYVDNALDRDVLFCQGWDIAGGLSAWVAIDHPVDDAMALDKEVDMHPRVAVLQEVLIDSDQQLDISVVVNSAPDRAQFVINSSQVTLVH